MSSLWLTAGLSSALLVGDAYAETASTSSSQQARKSYDIPAGPLESALNRFGREAGILLSFPTDATAGARTDGLSGNYSVEEALPLLLRGTGLEASGSGNTFVLRKVAGSAAGGDAQLPEVKVMGLADATTEGSGSYTTTGQVSTSTKLGLSPRETPQSMTIVTRQRMEEMGLQTLSETMQATTGIFVNANDTERITYNARGYSVTNFQVDGMLNTYGGSLKTNGDNVIYDRIEVVRGATGLTTGAGDPSATINQVRKRPTREFQGNAAVRIGSHHMRRGEIDLSGPLAYDGKIRGRFVAARQKADSFRPLYKEDRTVLYGILEADIGRDTVVAVGYEQQKSDPRGVTWGTVPYWNSDGSVANLPRNLNLSTPWASWNIDEKKTFATLEHNFNDSWRLRAAATHSDRRQDGSLYFGYGGYPNADGSGIFVAYGSFPSDEKMDVFDINLDGKYGLFGRRHDVVMGIGSSERKSISDSVYYDGIPAGYDVIPDWSNWTGNIPQFDVISRGFPSSISKIKQQASYVATRLNISDPLKVIVGVRYGTYETRTQNYSTTGVAATPSGYKNSGVLTPYAGLLYDIDDQWTVYTSYTDIFQPQNYRDKNNEILDPVVGKSYEIGIKGELFDKNMNVSAAVFRSNKDNVAEIDDSVPPNSLPGNAQAYKSTGKGNVVDGIELEASGQVTKQWNLSAGYSHTRSRNNKGEPINTVIPRSLLRVFTSYHFNGDWEGLTLGGGISLQSSFWNTARKPDNSMSRIDQGSVTLVNLMASYKFNKQWTGTLNVNNALDKHYYGRVGFYNGVHHAEPRSISLGLRTTF
ncbi:ferripyoverdine receptor [Oxalicibacterium flavum]|uniref:Ferripyoverdine receptor n=2 Tax=Oxalicibacterium flavum TaxID=179467 RepID=A0A8J2XXK3_9BURK|nr:ferripyoverdine receptor [Oxalicibacterium flavum]